MICSKLIPPSLSTLMSFRADVRRFEPLLDHMGPDAELGGDGIPPLPFVGQLLHVCVACHGQAHSEKQ
jgi:hypothetical protein